MKRITFELSTASIDKAIKELEAYKSDFANKVERVRQMVAERIGWSASLGFRTALVSDVIKGQPPTNDVQVTVEHNGDVSFVFADGTQAVFIEYGAGVYNNGAVGSSPHPWGAEKGYLIGEYGLGLGRRRAWGYREADGSITITHGTPAAMPMYNGVEEALRALDDIVKEVFG